jgi:hypothetical protein
MTESTEAAADAPAGEDSIPRELLRILRRHPAHMPERLVLLAVNRLGEPTKAWADERLAQPGASVELESERSFRSTLTASRIDGAVAGTPFFIALVPAYVSFLWTQVRMSLRIAALNGRDTTDPRIAAELLALRGVYPDTDAAAEAIAHLDDRHDSGQGRERIAVWYQLVRRILVMAGFMAAADAEQSPSKLRLALSGAVAGGIWIVTCLFPVSFMVLMAWGCETSTRRLAADVVDRYAQGDRPRAKSWRERFSHVSVRGKLLRGAIVAIGVGVPLVIIALAVSKQGQTHDWLRPAAAVAGLTLVLALAATTRR